MLKLGDLSFMKDADFIKDAERALSIIEKIKYAKPKPRLSDGNCDDDHGERTNTKLRAQPYHQRQRSGKMKRY